MTEVNHLREACPNTNLPSAAEIAKLREWKPRLYIAYSVLNIGAFVGLAWIGAVLDQPLVYCVCWLSQSAVLIGFSNAAHECTHDLFTAVGKVEPVDRQSMDDAALTEL